MQKPRPATPRADHPAATEMFAGRGEGRSDDGVGFLAGLGSEQAVVGDRSRVVVARAGSRGVSTNTTSSVPLVLMTRTRLEKLVSKVPVGDLKKATAHMLSTAVMAWVTVMEPHARGRG